MNRHESKRELSRGRRRRAIRAFLACLLPLLCGACSWFQTWQDNFKTEPGHATTQIAPLPVTEVPVRMLYPIGTQTVDEAISYMLEPHDYHPADSHPAGKKVAQRRFINNFSAEPVPLRLAMQRLLGQNGQIILDSDSKLYTYRLRTADEPGVVLADLAVATAPDRTAAGTDADTQEQELPTRSGAETDSTETDRNGDTHNQTTWRVVEPVPAEDDVQAVAEAGRCRSIQFTNRAMLSATVQEYFLNCGFDDVSWRLGEPGRYADYRLTQSLEVPLPDGHKDLIKLLQTRFGIKTLIHDNKQVEFHDEDNTM